MPQKLAKTLDSPWLLFVAAVATPILSYGVLGWFVSR